MVDLKKLRQIIDDSGMTMVAISSKSGILRETLYNRLNGKGEFTASEMMSISEVLHMPDEQRNRIFFAKEDDLNST